MSLTYLTVISRFWKLLNWKHKFVYRQYIGNFKISLQVFLHCITLINYFLDLVEHISIHPVSFLTLACNHGSFSPHPSDCTMYQVCVHGYLLNMTCVYGTAWSQANSSCVDAATVNCKFQDDTKGISPHPPPQQKKYYPAGRSIDFSGEGTPIDRKQNHPSDPPAIGSAACHAQIQNFFFRGGGGSERYLCLPGRTLPYTPHPRLLIYFITFIR